MKATLIIPAFLAPVLLLAAAPVWSQEPAGGPPAMQNAGPASAAQPQLPIPRDLLQRLLAQKAITPPTAVRAFVPAASDGLFAHVEWRASEAEGDPRFVGYVILRRDSEQGRYKPINTSIESEGDMRRISDKLVDDPLRQAIPKRVFYRIGSASAEALDAQKAYFAAETELKEKPDDNDAMQRRDSAFAGLTTALMRSTSEEVNTEITASFFNWSRLPLLLLIVGMGALMFWYQERMRRHGTAEIRRIAGIDAIEEAIGRATEMGRPVLYVPGIDELQDMQTIASMLILGRVAEIIARYDSDIIVSCCIPVVREVADEVVRTGFYEAGRPDGYRPENTRFISSEQFAFCAGTNGIMYREQPAANIFLGRFFAESLILAETGYVNGSIQVAGTAEATQLPFFIAACDYTLIGEELFAVSAYLSEDPRLVSSLKTSDTIKVGLITVLLIGTVLASFGLPFLTNLLSLGGA